MVLSRVVGDFMWANKSGHLLVINVAILTFWFLSELFVLVGL